MWCSLVPPRRGGSNEYPQSMFWAEIWKISKFLSENFKFLEVKFSIYFNRRVFVMKSNSLINLCQVNSSASTFWTRPFPVKGVSNFFLLLPCFIEIPVLNANNVNPDQKSCSVASDLGLHYLQMFSLWDARHKWAKGRDTLRRFSVVVIYYNGDVLCDFMLALLHTSPLS